MNEKEVASRLRELAREFRTIQHSIRLVLQSGLREDPATTRRLEVVVSGLERLAKTAEALATLVEES